MMNGTARRREKRNLNVCSQDAAEVNTHLGITDIHH
jgi:hypothetical protein